MSLNDQQNKIANTLEGAINVAAGAGTGKTFTLTRRILEFVKDRLQKDPNDLDPLSHVLAITFTNKAASELKSRTRRAFLEEASKGGRFKDAYLKCALTVDNAWISTIHSMAGRILRENAIEFKIDPEFEVLDSQAENLIFAQAVELAITDAERGDDEGVKRLVKSRKILSEGSGAFGNASTLSKILEGLLSKISYLPGGFDAIKVADHISNPFKAVKPLLAHAKAIRPLLDECEFTPKQMEKVSEYINDLDFAIPKLQDWLDSNRNAFEFVEEGKLDLLDAYDASIKLIEILGNFPETTDTFGNSKVKNSSDPYAFFDYRKALKEAFYALISNLMLVADKSLLKLAKQVNSYLFELKSGTITKMSESDMLCRCNRFLGMEEHADIVSGYRHKFELIMLDEFQDTDSLQLSLIGKLAKWESGSNGEATMSNLCTVGDMQQSIYRFRGADVQLSQARKRRFDAGEGLQLELTYNYRSHKDILDTVEMIFAQDAVFGEGFLKLEAKCQTLDESCADYFTSSPRVSFDYLHGGTSASGKKVSSDDLTRESAKHIAEHFRSLANSGVAPGDMALLLGSVKNANVYAEALGELGLECAITGGSLFSKMQEPKLVSWLLEYATNVNDDNALLNVLLSDLFEIPDDDLLLLCTRAKGGDVSHRSLSRAFTRASKKETDIHVSDQLVFARKLLDKFVREARISSVSNALIKLFSASGLLAKLEESNDAQSLVIAGTLKKAVDIVAEIEALSSGIAEVSKSFDEYLENAKESPGTLVTSNSDFIPVMTIHASKGLEFKHVAIAEFNHGCEAKANYFYAENIDDLTCFALRAKKEDFPSSKAYDRFDRLNKFKSLKDDFSSSSEDEDAGNLVSLQERNNLIKNLDEQVRFYFGLESFDKRQNIEEARRLLYVALTRARESLYVTMYVHSKPESGYKGTYADIFNAISGYFDKSPESFEPNFDFVKLPIRLKRTCLASDEFQGSSEESSLQSQSSRLSEESAMRAIPIYKNYEILECDQGGLGAVNEGLLSYSAIAKDLPGIDFSDDDLIEDTLCDQVENLSVNGGVELSEHPIVDKDSLIKEDPTALGTAFHRIAQASIIEAGRRGLRKLKKPKVCSVDAVSKSLALTDSQRERLVRAVDLWFESTLAKTLASFEQVLAEVPFGVQVESSDAASDGFCLYGAIDALGVGQDSDAFLVDYKTGNITNSSPEKLKNKYSFQAKCYAYALIMSGFKRVEATFVMVEKPVHESGSQSIEPMCIQYTFTAPELPSLRNEIIKAYETHVSKAKLHKF